MTVSNLVRVDAVLGSSADDVWTDRLRSARIEVLRLDQAEAQKSRLRKKASCGTEVAVSLGRGTSLRDGDVLAWDEQQRAAIVARVDLADVMVIDLTPLAQWPALDSMTTCVRLGHALGNQHWAALVKGLRVYVPLTVARAVMESVMRTHAFPSVTYDFLPGSAVISRLAPNEARRLFGAAGPHGGAAA